MKELPLINISDCFSKKDLINKLNLPKNGKTYKLLNDYIKVNKLDISHFDSCKSKRIYSLISKSCPICNKEFETKERSS